MVSISFIKGILKKFMENPIKVAIAAYLLWKVFGKKSESFSEAIKILKRNKNKELVYDSDTDTYFVVRGFDQKTFGSRQEAEKDFKEEYTMKVTEKLSRLSERFKESKVKIACTKCDRVATEDAWKKTGGFCPYCGSSTGVREEGLLSPLDRMEEKLIKKKIFGKYVVYDTEKQKNVFGSAAEYEVDDYIKAYQESLKEQIHNLGQGMGIGDKVKIAGTKKKISMIASNGMLILSDGSIINPNNLRRIGVDTFEYVYLLASVKVDKLVESFKEKWTIVNEYDDRLDAEQGKRDYEEQGVKAKVVPKDGGWAVQVLEENLKEGKKRNPTDLEMKNLVKTKGANTALSILISQGFALDEAEEWVRDAQELLLHKNKKPKESLKEGMEEDLVQFLKDNPNPPDEKLHSWAEEKGYNVPDVEAAAYKIATAHVKEQADDICPITGLPRRRLLLRKRLVRLYGESFKEDFKVGDRVKINPNISIDLDPARYRGTKGTITKKYSGSQWWIRMDRSGDTVPFDESDILKESLKEIVKPLPEEKADPKELAMGIKVEMEHTDDKEKAKVIALQHLAEMPDYYTKLKKMEAPTKKEAGFFTAPKGLSTSQKIVAIKKGLQTYGHSTDVIQALAKKYNASPSAVKQYSKALQGEEAFDGGLPDIPKRKTKERLEALQKGEITQNEFDKKEDKIEDHSAMTKKQKTDAVNGLKERLESLHESVVKRGDEWCVVHGHPKKAGSKTDKPKGAVIACHPTKKKAQAQHTAIAISQHKK